MALEFLSMVSAKKGTYLHNSILGLKGGESAIKKFIFYSLHQEKTVLTVRDIVHFKKGKGFSFRTG